MPKSKPSTVQARVLADLSIDGVPYRVDQVIELAAELAALYPNALDPHPDAVAWAVAQGAVPIIHLPTAQE